MKQFGICALSALLLLSACGGGRYAASEKIYQKKAEAFAENYAAAPVAGQLDQVRTPNKEWVATVNFGTRKPNYVILHHTAQNSTDHTIRTFHNERVGVSAHYVIGRDGKVVQMLNELYRAHHAGVGKWGNDTDLNSSSIGIELDNNGTTDPWPDVQIQALIQLLQHLKASYKIPQANFIGHADIAPGRKIDPIHFPWQTLANAGFGFWYGRQLETPPSGFDPKLALRVIGYDVTRLDMAIIAFKIHYIQTGTPTGTLSAEDLKILYAIFKQYL